jgi:hypothetical protein
MGNHRIADIIFLYKDKNNYLGACCCMSYMTGISDWLGLMPIKEKSSLIQPGTGSITHLQLREIISNTTFNMHADRVWLQKHYELKFSREISNMYNHAKQIHTFCAR